MHVVSQNCHETFELAGCRAVGLDFSFLTMCERSCQQFKTDKPDLQD